MAHEAIGTDISNVFFCTFFLVTLKLRLLSQSHIIPLTGSFLNNERLQSDYFDSQISRSVRSANRFIEKNQLIQYIVVELKYNIMFWNVVK